jgi:hypothetical protein
LPFNGNVFTPPAGSESAAPGAIVQSAVWNASFTDVASGLTQVMNQFNAGPVSIAGVGTTQAGAAAITGLQFYVRANAQSGQYALVMTASALVGNRYEIFNSGAVTMVVWPATGGQFNINPSATATGVSVVAGKGIALMTVTASTFDALLSL